MDSQQVGSHSYSQPLDKCKGKGTKGNSPTVYRESTHRLGLISTGLSGMSILAEAGVLSDDDMLLLLQQSNVYGFLACQSRSKVTKNQNHASYPLIEEVMLD